MKKTNKPFTFLFFFLFLGNTFLFAQSYQLTRQFTTEDGLIGMTCRSTFMDSKGYLWIATTNGISRYDGNGFKNFSHDPDNPTSICWNSTEYFYEDKEGDLWIGTGRGLAQFDYETENFTCYTKDEQDSTSISGDMVYGIYEDGSQKLWVYTHSAGFNLFDKESKTFQRFTVSTSNGYSQDDWLNNTIVDIVQDENDSNILWISAGRKGVFRFETHTRQISKIEIPIANNEGRGLYMDKQHLWIGTWGLGLLKYNTQTNTVQQFNIEVKNISGQKIGLIVEDIVSNGDSKLYLATFMHGVVVFDKETETFSFLNADLKRLDLKDINCVGHLFIDSKKRLWVSSRAGVLLYDPNAVHLNTHQIKTQNKLPHFYGNVLQNIDFDSKGNAWICSSYGDGVYKMNANRDTISAISIKTPRDKNNYIILDILVDQRDDVWIINQNEGRALMKYNPISQQFEFFQREKLLKLLNGIGRIQHLREDAEGNIWLALDRAGLIKYHVEQDTFKHFVHWEQSETVPDTRVFFRDLTFDEKGNIWLSSDTYGVYFFDTQKEKFTRRILTNKVSRLSSTSNNALSGIEVLANGKVWVSDNYLGIAEINPMLPDNQIPKMITTKDGLPDALIYGIDKDRNNNIWLASTQGLIKYDWSTKDFEIYGKKDGVKDFFTWYLSFKVTKTGEVFLGKRNGSFYLFDPDDLPVNQEAPKLVFTNFNVLGKEKEFEKNVNYLESIHLPYNENFFSISFAALNFTNPEDNEYEYQLEGFDKNWIQAGNNNIAAYTNVREGNYTFKVKASNNDGIWNEEGITIQIKIQAPWYRSSLAYLIYLLLLGGIAYAIYSFLKKRWQLRADLAIEQAEAQRLKEIDVVKTQLYTNITHEFRTPLTVILGLVDELQMNPKIKWESRLKTIQRNGQQLLDLINQMLDLSKLQEGSLKPNYIQGDIIHYLKYLTESYQSLAFAQNKNLAFFSEHTSLIMDYDTDKLHRIFGNLLSNAIKFTPEYGSIKVFVHVITNELFIKVSDTGIGIEAEKIPSIFDRFYQIDSSSTRLGEGTGIGLALVKEMVQLLDGKINVKSAINKGSTFEVCLPITKKAPLQEKNSKEIEVVFTNQGIDSSKIASTTFLNTDKPILLIIEDNWDVIEYLKTCLYPHYHFLTARNGKTGLELAQEKIPDIIISDVMMPEMDGFEVCQQIKTDQRTSHIPIILLTAKATQEDRISGLSFGADAYLAKPFDKNELLIRLEKLLALRKGLQARYTMNSFSKTAKPLSSEDEFLQKIQTIIHEHLEEEDFQVIHLCRAMNMSRSQLHRKIKALTNQSTAEFIKSIRLQSAQQLLENTTFNVSEIAYKVGYKHPSHFSTDFKKQFGVSPYETRK